MKYEYHRLSPEFIQAIAEHIGKNVSKYPDIDGKVNWKTANPKDKQQLLNSLFRHFNAIMKGELIDEESGSPHIIAVAANAMMVYYEEYCKCDGRS